MSESYKMKIAGLERELPYCAINEKLDIAAFIMFSDVELTVACAKELLKKYKSIIENCKVYIFTVNFDKTLSEKMTKEILSNNSILSCVELSDYEKQILTEENPNFVEGFVLKSEDKAITCRVLLCEIINNIKDKNSFELAQTLFCGRLPQ